MLSPLAKRGRDGSLAMLAGGALLARTVAGGPGRKARTAVGGLAGAGLLAVGLRQRRRESRDDGGDTDADGGRTVDGGQIADGETQVSDDAHAESHGDLGAQRNADEAGSVYQSESAPNPRGMSDRSDVEADQDGDVQFVEGESRSAHRETHLEDADAHDVRLHPESDDEPTEVDLSEAAMADEASEAAGPHTEQSYPAREGTDPEPTSERAPERSGEGAVAPTDPDSEFDSDPVAEDDPASGDDAEDNVDGDDTGDRVDGDDAGDDGERDRSDG